VIGMAEKTLTCPYYAMARFSHARMGRVQEINVAGDGAATMKMMEKFGRMTCQYLISMVK